MGGVGVADRTCSPEEARAVEEWETARFFGSGPGMAEFVREAIREQVAEWEAKDGEEGQTWRT